MYILETLITEINLTYLQDIEETLPSPTSTTGTLRVVILTDSPTKEREMPKRAASTTPEDTSSKEELERSIAFHQEALRKLIEGGVTGSSPAEKSKYYKSYSTI